MKPGTRSRERNSLVRLATNQGHLWCWKMPPRSGQCRVAHERIECSPHSQDESHSFGPAKIDLHDAKLN